MITAACSAAGDRLHFRLAQVRTAGLAGMVADVAEGGLADDLGELSHEEGLGVRGESEGDLVDLGDHEERVAAEMVEVGLVFELTVVGMQDQGPLAGNGAGGRVMSSCCAYVRACM